MTYSEIDVAVASQYATVQKMLAGDSTTEEFIAANRVLLGLLVDLANVNGATIRAHD